MPSFSQRMGLVPVRSAIQVDYIDEPLLNRLWTLVVQALPDPNMYTPSTESTMLIDLYLNFFDRAIDQVPPHTHNAQANLRKSFYGMEWNEVYDIIEFIGNVNTCEYETKVFQEDVNVALEKYLAAYRFVDGQLVQIVEGEAIDAIERAAASPLDGVRAHVQKALGHLARRDNPDVENSIKESVSAVESMCAAIVGRRSTLGEALKKLEDQGVTLHPALKSGWSSLYGFTSDADGVRHAMQDASGLTVDDATHFLVSCSAFVILLAAKASGAGLKLTPIARKV